MTPPIRASSIVRSPLLGAAQITDSVTLDHEDRYRRRAVLSCAGGLEVLLDLDKPSRLEDGDALKLDDGRLVRVVAAVEELVEITSDNPARLLRAGWHLGNRHTEAEITAEAIYVAKDHVLVEMLRGLGLTVRPVSRPFRPERGAYEHHHGHDHTHQKGHDQRARAARDEAGGGDGKGATPFHQSDARR
ncbi:MAG: urease accessory protein UreE [Hyphomicrobiales bacterium]|nr:urease accessory protein UreE [Hyphomicrobiales bacterium]